MNQTEQETREEQPAPDHTRAKGRAGEEMASDYLLSNGFTVITRNYQTNAGEIDCIAKDPNGVLVFIEVKASFRSSMGNPLFRVTRAKQRAIITMARRYMYEHNMTSQRCRFDVISIQNGQIKHLKNAFLG